MAYKLTQNPLEQNPLFSGMQQGSNEEKKPAAKKSAAKKQGAKKPETDKSEPVKAQPQPAPAKPKDDPEAYQRATFIVRRDLLDALKDYAYTERREIKEVINQILEEAMKKTAAEYAKAGKQMLPHR